MAPSSEDAYQWGLVSELRPREELHEAALEGARMLAAKPSRSFATIKNWLASDSAVHARIDEEVAAINAAVLAQPPVESTKL